MKRTLCAAFLVANSFAAQTHAAGTDSTIIGTFDSYAVDSAAARSIYSALTFSNPASSTTLESTDGSMTFSANLANEPGLSFSAMAGLLVPLEKLWGIHDLRAATSISFRLKATQECDLYFSFGSEAYPMADRGVTQVAPLKVGTTWKTYTLQLSPVSDLYYLSWMDDPERFPGGADAVWASDSSDLYFDSDLNIAKSVKNIQIMLYPTWNSATTWVRPVGPVSVSIDDIVLHGVSLADPPVIDPETGHPGHGKKPRKPKHHGRDRGCDDRGSKHGRR